MSDTPENTATLSSPLAALTDTEVKMVLKHRVDIFVKYYNKPAQAAEVAKKMGRDQFIAASDGLYEVIHELKSRGLEKFTTDTQ